jgi:hypothetical protein
MENCQDIDVYPEDYSEKFANNLIESLMPNIMSLLSILNYNEPLLRKLVGKVGLRDFSISDRSYIIPSKFIYEGEKYGRSTQIRICGHWLNSWGFNTGGRTKLITLPNFLILTPSEVADAASVILNPYQ